MSDASSAGLRAIAFGAADGSLWGAAFEHGARAIVAGMPRSGHGAAAAGEGLATGIRWIDGDDGGWRLEGDGLSLEATPLEPVIAQAGEDGEAGEGSAPGRPYVPGSGPDLCRVRGTLAAGGAFEGLGARVVLAPPSAAKHAPASARLVGAWFPDGAALALLAARPVRAEHQDADALTATLFDPEGWLAVDEPRLSTTFDGSGSPTRCNLELWLSEGENEFPRRAAGEVSGAGGTAAGDGLSIEVAPLRCHSRGEDGAGVYAVATFT